MSGWVKLHRDIDEHWLWSDKPFTKGQAWIDLIIYARFSDEPKSIMIKGKLYEIKRGQQSRSEKTLADTWGWSRNKVRRFLSRLKTEHMVEQHSDNKTSIITILNYDKYQSAQISQGTANETALGTPTKQHPNTDETAPEHNIRRRERVEGEIKKHILSTTVDDAQGGLDGLGNDMPIVSDGGNCDSHKDGYGRHGSHKGIKGTAGDSLEVPGRSPSGDCQVRGEDQGAGNQPTEPLGGGRIDEPGNYATQGNNSGDVAEYCGSDGTYGECGNGEQPPQGEDGGAEFHPQRKNYKDGGTGESDQVFGATERNDCSGDCGGEFKGRGPGYSGQLPLLDDVHDDSRPGIVQDDGEHRSGRCGGSGNEKSEGGNPEKCKKAEKPKKPKPKIPYEEIIDYLNLRTGKTFKPNTSKTVSLINGRWNEGFRLEDFKAVIDVKSSQWLGDSHMVKFLRPDTLFCGKFEGYLNEVPKRRDNIPQVKENPKQHTIGCRSCFGYEECMYSDDNGRSECALYSPKNGISQNILPFKSKTSRTPRQAYMDDLAAGFDAIDKEESRGS